LVGTNWSRLFFLDSKRKWLTYVDGNMDRGTTSNGSKDVHNYPYRHKIRVVYIYIILYLLIYFLN
jgi:hypothetical protein